jgi:enterochelin esterase family protein
MHRLRGVLCLTVSLLFAGFLSLWPPLSGFQAFQRNPGDLDDGRRRSDRQVIDLASGARVEFAHFYSPALKADGEFSIFLPPSYGRGTKRFPVVYFLHGLWNDHTSWTVDRYGRLHELVDRLIKEKRIPEILMVHPRGDNSFYTNFVGGQQNYEDFVTQDLIQHIESGYRAKAGRSWRAIGGTSMGGFGALKIAFKHKDLFCATAAHSPIILVNGPSQVAGQAKNSERLEFFTRLMTPIFGNPIDPVRWQENDPLSLARTADLRGLRIYFDYGTADRYNQSIGLGEGIRALDKVLTQHGIPHVFVEHPNEPHGWELVSRHLPESLAFLCQDFKG